MTIYRNSDIRRERKYHFEFGVRQLALMLVFAAVDDEHCGDLSVSDVIDKAKALGVDLEDEVATLLKEQTNA